MKTPKQWMDEFDPGWGDELNQPTELTEERVEMIQEDALRTAAAQHAPTQGGDWAEARKVADVLDEASAKTSHPVKQIGAHWLEEASRLLRSHLPQPDLASVRSAVRDAVEREMPLGLIQLEDWRIAAQETIDAIMSTLTPLLGANEDRERLIHVMQNAAQYIWEREGDDSPLVFSVREELRKLLAARHPAPKEGDADTRQQTGRKGEV